MNWKVKVLFIILSLLCGLRTTLWADGSKDLYPRGVRGTRAMLEPHILNQANSNVARFYNHARHFVYAKMNETIAVASSAMGVGAGGIRIMSPTGVTTEYFGPLGRIVGSGGLTNREAELAGPRAGYTPYEFAVNEEGIWTVEFISPVNNTGGNFSPTLVAADDEWAQSANSNFISAWDISVRNASDTEWISGRVYTNVLNLYMNGGLMNSEDYGFFGVNYVLTRDGNLYKVDGNGFIGLRFTYFVNNSGFLDDNGNPSYKSSSAGYGARIHNPNDPDVNSQYVTHKMFYALPSIDLPSSGVGFFGGTWLLRDPLTATVSNIRIGSSENTIQHVNTKGMFIHFETNYAGRYRVNIKSKSPTFNFPPKDIIVYAEMGDNKVFWEGLDGEGKYLPIGKYDIVVTVAMIEGEVHFPYFDMEINPRGLLLYRIDRAGATIGPATIYWDDSEIPLGPNVEEHSNPLVNLSGIPSNVNGHRWGTYSVTTPATNQNINNNFYTGANSFGNNMAMDTWSYAVQIEEKMEKEIVVEIADLETVSIEANRDTIELNEQVEYKVIVKNNGPSHALGSRYEFDLPQGFFIDNVTYQTNGCAVITSQQLNQHSLRTIMDIDNGCEVIVTITAHANNVPDETYGYVRALAGMVRPPGYIDPDATSSDITIDRPLSAQEECAPTGCNNIKIHDKVFLLEPYNERGKIALLKTANHIDRNGSGFQEEGEEIEYVFTIRNTGLVAVKDFQLTDSLLNVFADDVNVTLLPEEEYSFSRRYTIRKSDIERGYVLNQALVIGKNPRGFEVKDLSGTSFDNNNITRIDIAPAPYFRLRLRVTNTGTGENNQFTIGDTIRFEYTVKHEGVVSIQQFRVQHDLVMSDPVVTYDFTLQNRDLRFNSQYVITEEDIQRGAIVTSASLWGRDTKYGNELRDLSGLTFDDDQSLVIPLATAPTAVADRIALYQGQEKELNILENDRKGSSEWNSGKIEIIEAPSMGNVRVEGIKVFYKQHDNFESGEDYFTYRIVDNSRLASNAVRVDLTILKTSPQAVDDYFVQPYNGKIQLSVTRNDFVEYSEIDAESVRIISNPSHGSLRYQGNGIFIYESEKTFSGIDQFTYIVRDKNGNWSEEATVQIEVAGLVLPNVITPNGDGYNDTFEIIGLYKYDRCEFQVFDRFKNVIYSNDNYKNDWVVQPNVTDGTYFYLVRLWDKEKKPTVIKGHVLITREKLR